MSKVRMLDAIFLPIIVLLALATAYICFQILKSEAKVESSYSIAGGFAGFMIAFGAFFSAYVQLRRSSGETETLQARIKELESKLIRGAPCPKDFEIEVDDRRRIVLARPKGWRPKDGLIFNFEEFSPAPGSSDSFPATFTVRYTPLTAIDGAGNGDDGGGGAARPKRLDQETFYKNFLEHSINHDYVGQYTSEYITLGGAAENVRSIKIITRQYAKMILFTDPVTGIKRYSGMLIPKQDFESGREKLLAEAEEGDTTKERGNRKEAAGRRKRKTEAVEDVDGEAEQDAPAEEKLPPDVAFQESTRMYVVCFHPQLGYIFIFDFFDNRPDFDESSAKFNQILDSIRFLT